MYYDAPSAKTPMPNLPLPHRDVDVWFITLTLPDDPVPRGRGAQSADADGIVAMYRRGSRTPTQMRAPVQHDQAIDCHRSLPLERRRVERQDSGSGRAGGKASALCESCLIRITAVSGLLSHGAPRRILEEVRKDHVYGPARIHYASNRSSNRSGMGGALKSMLSQEKRSIAAST